MRKLTALLMAAAIVLAGAYFLTTSGVDREFPINGDNVSNLNTEEIIRKIADAENLEDGSLLCAIGFFPFGIEKSDCTVVCPVKIRCKH